MVERLVANEKVEGSTPFARSIINTFMILWISSYPKSGNTYIRSFLASYYFTKKGKFDFNLLMNLPQFPSTRFTKKDSLSFIEASQNWIPNQNFFFDKGKFFFLKTHNSLNKYYGQDFTTSDQTIGAIYIVRDPRNIILSMCNHYSFSIDYALESMLNKDASLSQKAANGDCSNFTYLGSWDQHYKSWKDNKKFKVLFVKYEDLKEKKIDIFKRIISFVNQLKGSKKTIDEKKFLNSVTSTNFVNLKNKEINEGFEESTATSKGDKINFFNLGFKSKWENMLPKEIVLKVNKFFEKELKELGYLKNE